MSAYYDSEMGPITPQDARQLDELRRQANFSGFDVFCVDCQERPRCCRETETRRPLWRRLLGRSRTP